jgi:hypothetical protein
MPAQPPISDRVESIVATISRRLAQIRWVFMPMGLLALIAVGVHAAADTLDDRILWLVDHADALFDRAAGAFSWTEGLVNLVGLEQRVGIARGVTLLWELAADAVLAWPAFGYREKSAIRPPILERSLDGTSGWRQLFLRVKTQPTTMRIIRPLATAAVVLAGACAVARMIQGSVFLPLRGVIGDGVAGLLGRVVALAVLAGVLYALGWRAVLRNLQDADVMSDDGRPSRREAIWRGAAGSAVVLPLAMAALVDASPILSFFR